MHNYYYTIDTGAYNDVDLDKSKYEEHVLQLKQEADKNHFNTSKVKKLMKDTFAGRRAWIKDSSPSVTEILLKFPCLNTPGRVSTCMHAVYIYNPHAS